MRRHQITITYPEGDAQQLHQALLLLKRSRCLNISAFCREAIAEKLERLEAVKWRASPFGCLMWRRRCWRRCRSETRRSRICSSCWPNRSVTNTPKPKLPRPQVVDLAWSQRLASTRLYCEYFTFAYYGEHGAGLPGFAWCPFNSCLCVKERLWRMLSGLFWFWEFYAQSHSDTSAKILL